VHSGARNSRGVRSPDSTSPATQTLRCRCVGARRRQLRECCHRDRVERRSHHRSTRASCTRGNRRRANLRLRHWRMCPRSSGRCPVDVQSTALRARPSRRRGRRTRLVAARARSRPRQNDIEYDRASRSHLIESAMQRREHLIGSFDPFSRGTNDRGEQIVTR